MHGELRGLREGRVARMGGDPPVERVWPSPEGQMVVMRQYERPRQQSVSTEVSSSSSSSEVISSSSSEEVQPSVGAQKYYYQWVNGQYVLREAKGVQEVHGDDTKSHHQGHGRPDPQTLGQESAVGVTPERSAAPLGISGGDLTVQRDMEKETETARATAAAALRDWNASPPQQRPVVQRPAETAKRTPSPERRLHQRSAQTEAAPEKWSGHGKNDFRSMNNLRQEKKEAEKAPFSSDSDLSPYTHARYEYGGSSQQYGGHQVEQAKSGPVKGGQTYSVKDQDLDRLYHSALKIHSSHSYTSDDFPLPSSSHPAKPARSVQGTKDERAKTTEAKATEAKAAESRGKRTTDPKFTQPPKTVSTSSAPVSRLSPRIDHIQPGPAERHAESLRMPKSEVLRGRKPADVRAGDGKADARSSSAVRSLKHARAADTVAYNESDLQHMDAAFGKRAQDPSSGADIFTLVGGDGNSEYRDITDAAASGGSGYLGVRSDYGHDEVNGKGTGLGGVSGHESVNGMKPSRDSYKEAESPHAGLTNEVDFQLWDGTRDERLGQTEQDTRFLNHSD